MVGVSLLLVEDDLTTVVDEECSLVLEDICLEVDDEREAAAVGLLLA